MFAGDWGCLPGILCDSVGAGVDSGRIGNGEYGFWIFWRPASAKKGQVVLERMCARSSAKLCRLCDTRAEEMAASRFFSNDKVTVTEILASAAVRTAQAAAGCHVLLIEDTSEINYQNKAGRKHALGTVGNGTDIGLFVHPALAIDAEDGTALGLGWATIWRRTKTKDPNYRTLPIEQKESHRWITTMQTARQRLKDALSITVIADREADIYELFARLPGRCEDGPITHLIVRATHDRALADKDRLFAAAAAQKEAGQIEFDIVARPGRPARHALLAVRFSPVTLRQPPNGADKQDPATLTLNLVEVSEINPPSAKDAVIWRLLTTHSVSSLADAVRIVERYRQRWCIEQLFRISKSKGFDLEDSLLADGQALERLAAATLVAATQLMQLVQGRDETAGNCKATRVFSPAEIVVLYALLKTLQGKTERQKNLHPAETLPWAAWCIARLGGWKGYSSARPPGPNTFIQGLLRFSAIAEGFALARQLQT
jgi:hypothetical protein